MPPVSQKQRALFRWAAENPKAAAKKGISPKVAADFNNADPGGKLPETVGERRERVYDHERSKELGRRKT